MKAFLALLALTAIAFGGMLLLNHTGTTGPVAKAPTVSPAKAENAPKPELERPADPPEEPQAEESAAIVSVDASQRVALGSESEVSSDLAGSDQMGVLDLRVMDQAGDPIAGASINLYYNPSFPGDGEFDDNYRFGATDAIGRCKQAALAPGRWNLQVTHEDFAGTRQLTRVVAGETDQLEVVLAQGQYLSGRVFWPNDSPVFGAEVKVHYSETQSMGSGTTVYSSTEILTTDADGSFRMGGFGAGREIEWVKAEALLGDEALAEDLGEQPGTFFTTLDTEVILGELLSLQLAPSLGLAGVVVDQSDNPISGLFTVSAWPVGEVWGGAHSLSEPFGSGTRGVSSAISPTGITNVSSIEPNSELPELDAGHFLLKGATPGLWMVKVESKGYRVVEPVQIQVPLAEDLVFVLPRSSTLTGVVRDPNGEPTAGASVYLEKPNKAFFFPTGESTETDAEGRFRIELNNPNRTVSARHDDWAPSEPIPVSAFMESDSPQLELTLRRGASVRGVVYREDGSPWPGRAVVAAVGPAAVMLRMGSMGGPLPVLTDGGGRFELVGLEPGKLTVSAGPDRAEIERRTSASDEDQDKVFLEIMGEILSTQVEVADGESVEVVLGAEPKDPVLVRGRVTRAGHGVNAMVMVLAEEGPPLFGAKGAQADDDGRFELELDRPGTYVFFVQGDKIANKGEAFGLTIPEGASYEVELELTTSSLSGVVLGPDGKGLGNISLSLTPEDGANSALDFLSGSSEKSSSDGSFSYEGVKPGSYTLRANVTSIPGNPDVNPIVGSALLEGLDLGRDQALDDIVLRLPSGVSLEGVVRDQAGRPVAGANVFVRNSSGQLTSVLASTKTKPDGSYRVDALAEGDVTVFARLEELVTRPEAPVALAGSSPAVRDLELMPGAYLVLDAVQEDQPVRVTASVVDEEGQRWSGLWTDDEIMAWMTEGLSAKELRVGPLPSGRYTIKAVTLDGGAKAKKTVTLREGQAERRIRLRMR